MSKLPKREGRPPRFQAVEVMTRTGRTVVRIRDTKAGRDHFIHRKGRFLLHWDRHDQLVENALLRQTARNALAQYAEEVAT